MKKALRTTALLAVVLALAACTAGTGESQHAAAGGALSQFLLGLWHGFIAPVTLIVEVVNHFAPHLLPWTLHMYEPRDTAMWYDLGFYAGLAGSPTFVWRGWSRRG